MQTQAHLCHIDDKRCVVMVSAIEAGEVLGSALGESDNAEDAENRALERLLRRLQQEQTGHPSQAIPPLPSRQSAPIRRGEGSNRNTPTSEPATPATSQAAAGVLKETQVVTEPRLADTAPTRAAAPSLPEDNELDRSDEQTTDGRLPSEAPSDPDDWSDELAAVDLQIQRIGWDRDQERSYLERAFGHSSRHKLTRYSDLLAYLKRLKALEPGTPVETAPVPLRRADLIVQGDQMLKSLNWNGEQARGFLQGQLGANSRQTLSDEQLLSFNLLLENELVKQAS